MSRLELDHLREPAVPGVDFQALAEAQRKDTLHPDSTTTSLHLQEIPIAAATTTLLCDVSTGTPRPYVPPSFRRRVVDSLHSLSDPDIRATQQLITSRYVWPSINKDVRQWTRSCLQCQRSKVQRHTHTPAGAFTPPDARFTHVHIDIVGPLPTSNGYTHLLTAVDRFTRWQLPSDTNSFSTTTTKMAISLKTVA